MDFNEVYWELILRSIERHKIIPFLGAGAAAPFIPLAKDLANTLAEEYDYPFKEYSNNLSKVGEFVGLVENDDKYPKTKICDLITKVNPPDFTKYKNTSYAILADLPLPIYITTNYDHFLEEALKSRGKTPVSEFCVWNEELKEYMEECEVPSVFQKTFKPTTSNPLVYHLHGDTDEPKSIVLTEQDYIHFLKNFVEVTEDKFLPLVIRKGLIMSSLLFIGYSLQDLNIQLMMKLTGNVSAKGDYNFAVFPALSSYSIDSNKSNKFKPYIEEHYKTNFKTRIFWGTAEEFTIELRNRLEKYNTQQDEKIENTNTYEQSKKIWYTSDGKPVYK